MRKISYLFAALALLLSGCTLARPERNVPGSGADRFCGLYLVYSMDSGRRGFYDNPNLTEYGTELLDTGKTGAYGIPHQVLFAGEDGCFPGLTGTPLYELEVEESYGHVCQVVSQMADGNLALHQNDEGLTADLFGILYMGPPADAAEVNAVGIWTAYNVYQTSDGRAYLDGSGDSFHGMMTITREASQSSASGGTTQTETVRVKVEVKETARLESVALLQYDGSGKLLTRRELPLVDSELSNLPWLEGADWALVEEISPSGVTRTAYSRPKPGEDPVSHQLILLDAAGLGRAVSLTLEP